MEFEKVDESKHLKVLIFGGNGVGKTVASITAPGPVLIADAEAGLLSIRSEIISGQVKAVKISNVDDLKSLSMELKTTAHGFATVVIDSLSEVQIQVMENVMASQKDKDVPAMRDWYVNTEEMRKIIRFFRDLPMNVIFNCLPKDEHDEQYGTTVRKPSLSGKLPEEVCGYVDEVLYMFTKEEGDKLERYFLTQPNERVYAKDRSGKLERFEPPDISNIYNKIFGKSVTKGGKA